LQSTIGRKISRELSSGISLVGTIAASRASCPLISNSCRIGSSGSVYADVRDAASGSIVTASVSVGQNISTPTYFIYRGAILCDSSEVPAGATIVSAELWLYGLNVLIGDGYDIVIQNGQPTAPHNPIVGGDYDRTLYAGDGGSINNAAWVVEGWNKITLNATGKGWIQKGTGAVTKLMLRSSKDIANDDPRVPDYLSYYNVGTSGKEPYILVFWTV